MKLILLAAWTIFQFQSSSRLSILSNAKRTFKGSVVATMRSIAYFQRREENIQGTHLMPCTLRRVQVVECFLTLDKLCLKFVNCQGDWVQLSNRRRHSWCCASVGTSNSKHRALVTAQPVASSDVHSFSISGWCGTVSMISVEFHTDGYPTNTPCSYCSNWSFWCNISSSCRSNFRQPQW